MDSHDAHEAHRDSPVIATIVALLLVAAFSYGFGLLDGAGITTTIYVIAALIGGWSLFAIWVLDRRD
jgi:hypothetical protein